MTDTLLINRDTLMTLTSLNGNIDSDKVLPFIKVSQDTQIEPILGSKLMDKLKELVDNNNVTGDYQILLEQYVAPCLAHYTVSEFIPFIQYEIANGGVFQHQSENSATPSRQDGSRLADNELNQAQHYGKRLIDYLCANTGKFPELNQNTGSDVRPHTKQISNQWFI